MLVKAEATTIVLDRAYVLGALNDPEIARWTLVA